MGFFAVGYFLITLFFSVLLSVLWIRIFLRLARVSYLNSLSQMIYKISNPLVTPLGGFISSSKQKLPQYDWPCFILIILVELLKFVLISFFLYQALMPVSYLLLFIFADLIVQPANLLFFIVLVRVVMSWINPNWYHPAAEIINKITEPVLALGRYVVPNISGFDFSPFVVLIFLKVVTLFMTASMPLKLL